VRKKEVANSKIKYEIIAVNKTAMAFKAVKMGLSGIATAGKAGLFAIKAMGAAAITAAASIALLTKKSFDYIDTLGKTASRTGIATETLQAFQLAAIESGTTVEQTQKGLEKFARSIGDAGRGLKTQVDIFSDLGVTLKNTDGSLKSFETILEGVAEGLGELGSEAERATALANLFGRAGIQFSEIFRDGADGLEEFTRRANDLGIILDDKTIRGVEQFNDTMSVVKLQVGAVVNNITAAFVPALQFLAEELKNVIKDSKNTAEGFDTMGQLIAVSILEGVKTALIAMQTFFTNVRAMFIDFASTGIGKLMFGDILSETDKTLLQIKKFEDRIDDIRKNGFAIGGDIIPPGMPAAMDELIRLGDIVRRLKASIADPIDAEGGFIGTIDHMIALVKAGSPEVEKLFETFDSGLTNLLEPVAAFEKSLGAEGLAKTLETTAVSSMKKFEDSIVDSLKAGKLSFKNFADYVVEQLLRIAIQQMILKPITGKFESFFKGFGDIFSADGGGYTGSGIRAGGVDGKGGFPAILHPNETVVDHTKGQGMTASPTVNFNISTVDAAGFDQLLASRKGLITSIINNAMNNQGKMGIV
jgi:hypothetical protein